MKKLKWLILVMCCVLGLSVFAACGGDNGGTDNKTVAATGITLAPERAMYVGNVTVLTAMLEPYGAEATVTWQSSDAAIASVSTEGQKNGSAKVTAVAVGEATITATANGKTATCKIIVTFPESDIRIKGDYNGWGVTSLCAGGLNATNDFTATFTVKYDGAQKDFGLYSAKPGEEGQVSWARDDVELDLTGITGITNGDSNWTIAAGVYEFTVTVDTAGKFTAISVKEDATEDANTVTIPPVVKEFDMYFRGNWGGEGWTNIRFGNMTYDKDHLTATADIVLQTADGFGVMPAAKGSESQAGWANSAVMHLAEGVDGIELPATAGNAACTKAGTYNVTIEMNANFEVTSVTFNSYTAPAAE